MINSEDIKPNMRVVTAQAEQFAVVDSLNGADSIKLKEDASGHTYYIPLSWIISSQEGVVKINRTLDQIRRDWSDIPLNKS
ncbi:MAG: DUF2171 domain-containing protein [Methylophilaceae bacterium]